MIGSIIITVLNANKSENAACDEESFMKKSIASVLPIATESGTGTAFAIDGEGTLVTAYHVVEDHTNIRVSLVSGEVSARVIRTAAYDFGHN